MFGSVGLGIKATVFKVLGSPQVLALKPQKIQHELYRDAYQGHLSGFGRCIDRFTVVFGILSSQYAVGHACFKGGTAILLVPISTLTRRTRRDCARRGEALFASDTDQYGQSPCSVRGVVRTSRASRSSSNSPSAHGLRELPVLLS